MSFTYRQRIVDTELERRLSSAGAVVIEGPKACGKTETASQQAASSVLIDTDKSARAAIAVDPSLILDGTTPRLLDEWQVETDLWNYVRRAVDDRQSVGQFILTGSAVPAEDSNRHSGAGRFSFLKMRPMSLYESGRSSADVSLASLLSGDPVRAVDTGLTISDIAELVVRGGWPAQQENSVAAAVQAARDYLHQVQQVDISRVGKQRRDPNKVGRFLHSLSRNIASETPLTTLAADTGGNEGPLNRETLAEYHNALEQLMVVEDQPAWQPHLRSKRTLRSSPKRHFTDPSLAAAGIRATPETLMQDLNTLGFLFESLVIRDLRVLSQSLDGTVLHYRDNKGLEVDAVIQLADGKWAAFEIKLGAGRIEQAASSLKKFSSTIDTEKTGQPATLGVIVGTGLGYVREDGISIIPIGTLGP